MMKQEDADALKEMIQTIMTRYEEIKDQAESDTEIDEFDLDRELLRTPKLHSKYLNLFTENTLYLKDLYSFKEKVKLERWKYWQGKQSDRYYTDNGPVHEKILKTDLDKYLGADDKLKLVNDACSAQKAICDYLERTLKEIGNRGFHIKSAIEWRKFCNGS